MIRNLCLILWTLPAVVSAQTKLDITGAQGQMHNRISAVVDKRAKELGVNQDVVNYCRIELNHRTDQFPENGSIPFGINYHHIKDQAELTLVISARESYEKTFMILCLSNAKRDLSAARLPPNNSFKPNPLRGSA